jgi:hypothetical protein
MQRKNTRTWTYLNKAGKTCIITLETKREEKIKEKSNFFFVIVFFLMMGCLLISAFVHCLWLESMLIFKVRPNCTMIKYVSQQKVQSNENTTYQERASNVNEKEKLSTQCLIPSTKSFYHGTSL